MMEDACEQPSNLTKAEIFEAGAAKLLDLLMDFSDRQTSIADQTRQVLETNKPHGTGLPLEYALAIQRDADGMDELIGRCLEVVGDLQFAMRKPDEKSVVHNKPTVTTPPSVDLLDAYLGHDIMLPSPPPNPTTMATAEATTSANAKQPTAQSLLAQQQSLVQQENLRSLDIFSVLASRVKPELPQQQTQQQAQTQQVPSPVPRRRSGPGLAPGRFKRSHHKRPVGAHETMTLPDAHLTPRYLMTHHDPTQVLETRLRGCQREYYIRFHGVKHPVWMTTRLMTDHAKKMVHAFNTAQNRRTRKKAARANGNGGNSSAATSGDVFVVDKIVNHRFRYGKKLYLVKWDGYESDANTWEPASKLRREVPEFVNAYERKVAKQAAAAASASGAGAGGDDSDEEEDEEEGDTTGHEQGTVAARSFTGSGEPIRQAKQVMKKTAKRMEVEYDEHCGGWRTWPRTNDDEEMEEGFEDEDGDDENSESESEEEEKRPSSDKLQL